MDQKKRVSSLKQYPVLAAFTLFFAALFVLDLVTPDRAYSELENTTLTQRPKLTAVSVDGLNNYFTNYTKYVKDQVFGRDQWISLQSLAETTLFQKTQSGGILLGREHRMFARRYRILPTEELVWNKNLAAVQSLGERYPGKVSFMLVPSASVLYPEDLPLAAPQMDEEGRIDEAQAALPAVQFLRVTDALRAHKDEYLYYRTDHHWTTLGAYYAYEQFCEAQSTSSRPNCCSSGRTKGRQPQAARPPARISALIMLSGTARQRVSWSRGTYSNRLLGLTAQRKERSASPLVRYCLAVWVVVTIRSTFSCGNCRYSFGSSFSSNRWQISADPVTRSCPCCRRSCSML